METDCQKAAEGSFDKRFSLAAAGALKMLKKPGHGSANHDVVKMYNNLGHAVTATTTTSTGGEAAAA
jgi:citrate synthase